MESQVGNAKAFVKARRGMRGPRFPGRPRPVIPTMQVARQRRWGHAARMSGLHEREGIEIRGRGGDTKTRRKVLNRNADALVGTSNS